MKKLNVLLLIALILGAAYLVYSIVYWSGAVSAEGSDAEQAGAAIASVLVLPHLLLTGIAVLFNALALFMARHGFALAAGILYVVAAILFPAYFMFVIVQAVLCFIAYATMKKASQAPIA
ncbi:MAG: hypothetical protein IJG82_01170 [Atopobiaceae bacterium]|nr:hypothetical protein [Atopobiaceae bacterium]